MPHISILRCGVRRQLTSNGSATYVYDALGQRIEKGGWPTSIFYPRLWVPHISILRCGFAGFESGEQCFQFTSYERDAESGNDYAQARYYANIEGQFMSPDPADSSMDLADPQTLNLDFGCKAGS